MCVSLFVLRCLLIRSFRFRFYSVTRFVPLIVSVVSFVRFSACLSFYPTQQVYPHLQYLMCHFYWPLFAACKSPSSRVYSRQINSRFLHEGKPLCVLISLAFDRRIHSGRECRKRFLFAPLWMRRKKDPSEAKESLLVDQSRRRKSEKIFLGFLAPANV